MKAYRVTFRPAAVDDLINLYDYIAGESGPTIALNFVNRLEDACLALSHFPERGSRRDDVRPGLRIIGFERRATIAFRVHKSKVQIIRIFYGGRDWERLLNRS